MTSPHRPTSRTITTLVGWGIGLQAFGAIYRPEVLGFFAASPGVLLLGMAALLSLPEALEHGTALRAWLLLGWGLVASLPAALVFGWSSLYAAKVVPLLILSISWMAPLLCLRALTVSMVRTAVISGIAISLLGYVVSDLQPTLLPDALRALIFGGGYDVYHDSRPRAFMTETSHFAALLGRYALVLMLISEAGRSYSAIRLLSGIGVITVGLFLTESKGAALSMAVTLLLTATGRRGLPYTVLLVPAAWFLIDSQICLLYTSPSPRD